MRYIEKIGVEIEGGWCNPLPPSNIYYDGSVKDLAEIEKAGEISSTPLSLIEIQEFISRNYPDKVNYSCGLHIHLSFKNNFYYSLLITRDFYDFFLFKIEEWGKEEKINDNSIFWERWKGECCYCKRKFSPEQQINLTSKGSIRYTHLNYCYALHGTIEVRIFPSFEKSRLAISAVKRTIEIFESWLSKMPKKKTVVIFSVKQEETTKIKEVVLCA